MAVAKKKPKKKSAARVARKEFRVERRANRKSEKATKKASKGKAPSRKKSEGNYAKVSKKGGTGAKAGGGMTSKGVAKYRKDNPGSKLKTAVTKPPSQLKAGSKDAKRRKSFCARSKSWKSERGLAARRKWNC
mgnify:CR=1 FL=1|tara:strand:- start:817 stop:1215 length:399 start_codon:yes stop_codon:yes gene_type:complete